MFLLLVVVQIIVSGEELAHLMSGKKAERRSCLV
jgi:hypothetical protein